MEEQILQATIQSILGLLPLHSSASAQGSCASTPGSRVLFLAVVTGKESNTWEVTLPKQKPCWGSARPGGAQGQHAKRSRGKQFLPTPPHSHQVPQQGRVCVHTFVYTLWQGRDLGQLIALWILPSTHSIKQQLSWSEHFTEQGSLKHSSLHFHWDPRGQVDIPYKAGSQARLVPSSVCKGALGLAGPGKLCDQGKLLQKKDSNRGDLFPIFIWFLTTEEYTRGS